MSVLVLALAGLDHDAAKLSLVEALVRYARRAGSTVVAQGIETLAELEILADLDSPSGRAAPLDARAHHWLTSSPTAATLCRTRAHQAL